MLPSRKLKRLLTVFMSSTSAAKLPVAAPASAGVLVSGPRLLLPRIRLAAPATRTFCRREVCEPKKAAPTGPMGKPASAKVTLAADALFDYDKAVLRPEGRSRLTTWSPSPSR